MSFEVDFQPVHFDYLDERYNSFLSNKEASRCYHGVIFTSFLVNPRQFARSTCQNKSLSKTESTIQKISQDYRIAPMGTINGEIGGKISWGGENGVQASGYASGSASDDNGNTIEATVEVNSDGSGTASVSASHEEKTDS